jgi:phospholipase/carboxylesterase
MPLKTRQQKFAGLQTVVAQTGTSPTIPVILCHGYGASGEDLVSLAEPICDWLESSADQFQFIFPAAPLSPPDLAMYGGRAWWAINMAKLLAASQSGSFQELHELEPPGIEKATDQLAASINAIMESIGDVKAFALGGFSQGAMVTMNAALRAKIRLPDLLVQFSGTVVCRPQWHAALQAGRFADTFVLQSHGRMDTVLPFSSAEVLRDLFAKEKVNHQFIPFNGPHTIPMEAMMQFSVKLKQLAADS